MNIFVVWIYDFKAMICYILFQASRKVQQILDIWSCDMGVVSLHCFQSVIPVEAYTREACMVEAMGIILNFTFNKSPAWDSSLLCIISLLPSWKSNICFWLYKIYHTDLIVYTYFSYGKIFFNSVLQSLDL